MQTVRVHGASLVGMGADPVTVEGQFTPVDRSGTEVIITGLPDPVIRESRARLLCALRENRLRLQSGRLFLNLVPAAQPKAGSVLDLPLVLAAAGAAGHLPGTAFEDTLFLGELGIDGSLHGVPGGLAAGMAARSQGLRCLVGPPQTAREAACLPELEALSAGHLSEVLGHLTGSPPGLKREPPPEPVAPSSSVTRLEAVRGHRIAKHALATAAAGGHGILFVGPPGVGKTLLARALLDLLPPLDLEERLEVTCVLSASGTWPGGLARSRPFRAPHHSTTHAGMVGGGPLIGPGEITLAHRGVLFLDELPEFRRGVLEALRQPMESGEVHLARAGRQVVMPARFQLVAAMNPCPCGYKGHPKIVCRCAPGSVARYRQKISGPLMDRVDLRVEIRPPNLAELAPGRDAPPSEQQPGAASAESILRQTRRADERRAARGQSQRNVFLGAEDLDRQCPLTGEARELMKRAAEERALSPRALQSVRRVARTLADLHGRRQVDSGHLAGALGLRAPL